MEASPFNLGICSVVLRPLIPFVALGDRHGSMKFETLLFGLIVTLSGGISATPLLRKKTVASDAPAAKTPTRVVGGRRVLQGLPEESESADAEEFLPENANSADAESPTEDPEMVDNADAEGGDSIQDLEVVTTDSEAPTQEPEMVNDADAEAEDSIQNLEVGVPITLSSLMDGEVAVFRYEKVEAVPALLTCKTTSPEEGNVDLIIWDEVGPFCTSDGLGADETCALFEPSWVIYVNVSAVADSTNVTIQCDTSLVEDLAVGVDIPVRLEADIPLYLKYVVPENQITSIRCTTTAPVNHSGNVDMRLSPENSSCSNEACSATVNNGTVFVKLEEFEGQEVSEEVVLRCNVGPVDELVMETVTPVVLDEGGLRVFQYAVADEAPAQIRCQVTVPTTDDIELQMGFDDPSKDARTCMANENDWCHLGVPKNNVILVVSVISKTDTPIENAVLECTSEAKEISDMVLEAGIPRSIIVSDSEALFFSYVLEEARGGVACQLTAPDSQDGNVHLSLSVPAYDANLLVLDAFANSGENATTRWSVWPVPDTEFRVMVENFGNPDDQEVELICDSNLPNILVFDEPSPSFSLRMGENRYFVLDLSAPSQVNCTLTTGNDTELIFGILETAAADSDGSDTLLCVAASPESECSVIVLDTSEIITVEVFAQDVSGPDDGISLLCTANELDDEILV